MLIFFVVACAAIILFWTWMFLLYVVIRYKKYKVLKSFNTLYNLHQQQYDLLQTIAKFTQSISEIDNNTVTNIVALKDEASSINKNEQNIDRKIAYDSEIIKCMNKVIPMILNAPDYNINKDLKSAVDSYIALNQKITVAVKIYNKKADKLKVAVEVFPFSFVARLAEVKRFDYYKTL